MPEFSIVTPMYNSFGKTERFWESFARQTHRDFEVILIDDCSTDDSFRQAKAFAEKAAFPVLVYKTEKNGGPGPARNLGIEKASGEWLTFVDSDDRVDPRLLEKVDRVLEREKPGCVIFDLMIETKRKAMPARSLYAGKGGPLSLSDTVRYVRNHTVGKVYRLSACRERGIFFPALRRCEDVAFVARAVDACQSVYYLDEPLYYYRQSASSLSNDPTLDERDLLAAFAILEETLGEKYRDELREKSVTDLLYGALLLLCKAGKDAGAIRSHIDWYEKRYPAWRECEIIGHLGRFKRLFLKAASDRRVGLMKGMTKLHSWAVAHR